MTYPRQYTGNNKNVSEKLLTTVSVSTVEDGRFLLDTLPTGADTVEHGNAYVSLLSGSEYSVHWSELFAGVSV